jgi:hydroxyethylthiazole kinase
VANSGERHDPAELLDRLIAATERVRARRPRVHVLTNFVAMNISANALLALGATPSMTFRADTILDFVETSEALVVNLGMLDAEREAAIRKAVPGARERGRPFLLDPVKVDRSGTRRGLAIELLGSGPAVLRANQAEVGALAPGQSAADLARRHGTVVAATGEIDLVTGAGRSLRIANGSPLMDRVTAMGCACSAVLGAYLAAEPDPFLAAAAGVLAFGVAGDIAEEKAAGPGSFVPAFLDALYHLDASTMRQRARLT